MAAPERVSPDSSAGNGGGPQRSPIFICGFARSGTTILYELVAEMFDAVIVDAFTVLTMDAEHPERFRDTPELRERFDRDLQRRGAADRGVDTWKVESTHPEEFTRIRSGRPLLPARSRVDPDLVARVVARLGELHGPRPVVLKDPRAVGAVAELAQRFGDSAFVFLRRPVASIVDSQARATVRVYGSPQPYMGLVEGRYPLLAAAARFWVRTAGTERAENRMRMLCARALGTDIPVFLRDFEAVPADRRVVIDYEELCRHPETELAKVGRFGTFELPADLSRRLRAPGEPSAAAVRAARRHIGTDVERAWRGPWEGEGFDAPSL